MKESRTDQLEKRSELKAFPVPFALGEIKENIYIPTNIPTKEQLINKALNFHSKGKITEALKYYNYLIKQGFKDPIVFSNYGNILKSLNKLEEAEKFYRKAIEINPDFAEAYLNLGTILKDLNKLKEAEISHLRAIQLKPYHAIWYSNLGIIQRDLGKLEEAEISLRKAIKLKPDLAEAHCNLGNVLKDFGKLEEAENSYSNAIALKPDFSIALMNRWEIYTSRKEFHLALNDANSCDTELSRVCALQTLYSLGRIEEIYKRIQKNKDIDKNNIEMAAFSSFIAASENRYTSNNFCRDPLSFLYFSNLESHFKDHTKFIKETTSELKKMETVWQPPQKTTRNGFQTPNDINLFSNTSETISRLKSIIFNELDSYYLKFKNESCTYMQNWPLKKRIFGWHVILKKQGYQDSHIHPSGWLSGVIYLKVVPTLDKNEGAIKFSLNGINYSNTNSPELIHQPEVGDIVLFPSSLHHRTIPFSTDTERIVVAFDLLPN